MSMSFFIDTSLCTACRTCQVACKQWRDLSSGKFPSDGACQNPDRLSYSACKLVRMTETIVDGRLRWLFFPEQCRHCKEPSCMYAAFDNRAIYKDPETGAVVFTGRTRFLDVHSIMEACPYRIPAMAPDGTLVKCNMCLDRVRKGLEPACVKACPSGAMYFGESRQVIALAEKRLAHVRKTWPGAVLSDPEDAQTLYLTTYNPGLYSRNACLPPGFQNGVTRNVVLRKMFRLSFMRQLLS